MGVGTRTDSGLPSQMQARVWSQGPCMQQSLGRHPSLPPAPQQEVTGHRLLRTHLLLTAWSVQTPTQVPWM